VDLNFSARGDKRKPKKALDIQKNRGSGAANFGSSGHAFSADNPYGRQSIL